MEAYIFDYEDMCPTLFDFVYSFLVILGIVGVLMCQYNYTQPRNSTHPVQAKEYLHVTGHVCSLLGNRCTVQCLLRVIPG